ncbi:HDOD domain-containing protein [Geovibrio ferrireducens]|jgi:HD-like signal output (HDOD) protein|uniref:HDOD domain-containing protein n=1 Tax=Geovibrio ferrireducens TaxID=46201 RepID=UPI0022474CA4|nr:HDOD domain-containing protein [Geovibrio ferrireducens]
MQRINESDKLKSILDSVRDFPPIPQTAFKVVKILENPEYHVTDLVYCVSKDMGLTTEILRLANSALYSPSSKISTIKQAITYLGMSTVKNLVISLSSKALFGSGNLRLLEQKLWEHSLTVAISARLTALKAKPALAEECFIIGLLHDLGQLILAKEVSSYESIVQDAYNKKLDLRQMENENLGFDHTDVGGLALEKWGMPGHLTDVVRWHHQPDKSSYKDLAHLICFANNLTKSKLIGINNHHDTEKFQISMKYLGMTPEDADELESALMDIYEKEKELFKI